MAKQNTTGLTPVFTLNFPNLFEPSAFKDPKSGAEGKPKYGCAALFDKSADLSGLITIAKAAAENEWGPDQAKWPKMPDFFRDQGEKAKDVDGKRTLPPGHEAGAKFLYLDSAKAPVVVDQAKKDITDKARIYSGARCVAAVNAKAWMMSDRFGTKAGIKFHLNGIQLVDAGERLGGGVKVEEMFSPVAGYEAQASSADIFKSMTE